MLKMDEYNECKLTEAFRTIGILVNEYRDTVDDISDEILENLRKAIANELESRYNRKVH